MNAIRFICFPLIKIYFYKGRCHPSYLNEEINVFQVTFLDHFKTSINKTIQIMSLRFFLSTPHITTAWEIKIKSWFLLKEIPMHFIHKFSFFRKKLQDIWSVGGIVRKRWDNWCISNIVSVVVPCNVLRAGSIRMNVWRNDFSVIDGQWFCGSHSNHCKQNNCNLH